MPYIKFEDRNQNTFHYPSHAGELNWAITMLCKEYLELKGLRYQNVNEIVGALECAKQEFYRRVASPYEDTKIEENGDVYD